MRRTDIVLVLCACVWLTAGDGSLLKAKTKIIARLASKHYKRGVLSAVPPYKLGHDIPHVTHSIVKPIVVTYPPTAAVSAVKVPLSHPLLPRYPVPVGHRVPVPHPHYGLKFPHHHKSAVFHKPDQHHHHHHHHVAPRPVIPVVPAAPVPAPVVPVAAPSFARPLPVPSPPVALPAQVVQPALVHVGPAPALPAPAPVFNYPQYAPQIPYVLRPGGAVQSSLFANYPRYPLLKYQGPVFPLHASSFSQIFPHGHIPQYYPQGDAHDGVVIEPPQVQVEPTPVLHAQGEYPHGHGVHPEPAQPALHVHSAQPELHVQGHPGLHLHVERPTTTLHYQPGVLHAGHDGHLQPAVDVQPDLQLQPGVRVPQSDIHYHGGQPGVLIQPGQQEVHFHAGQPGLLHPGVQVNTAQPGVHFHVGQPEVQLQPGQPDVHFHGGQPDVHLQPGVQVDSAGRPDVRFQQPDFYRPGQTDSYGRPTYPTADHDGWSPVPPQNDLGLPNGHYPDEAHHQLGQDQGHQQFDQGHQQFDQGHQQFDQGHQQFDEGHQQFDQGHQQFDQGHQQFDQGHQQFDQGHQQFDQGHQQFDQGHQQFDQGHQFGQGHQGYDYNANDAQNDYQNQLQNHIQHQLDQAQFEQSLNNQHQLGQEYGVPNAGQASQDYPQNHQPANEYGLPQQGAEGRSSEGQTDEPEGDAQLFHNHIPLGLQPPIDRPLEHFR